MTRRDGAIETGRSSPGFTARRRLAPVAPGVVRVDQHTICRAAGTGFDATGPCWIVAVLAVSRGRVSYVRGAGLVPAPGRRFGVIIPPRAVVECRLAGAHVRSAALAGRTPWPAGLPGCAVAFHPAPDELPASPSEIARALRQAHTVAPIGRDLDPSPRSRRLKALIDDGFERPGPLQALAARLRASPAALSRGFRRDYGLPPAKYRHIVRVVHALVRLIDGEPVLQVAGEVGFGDVGQFYRHFNVLACGTPGRYRHASRIPKIAASRA